MLDKDEENEQEEKDTAPIVGDKGCSRVGGE